MDPDKERRNSAKEKEPAEGEQISRQDKKPMVNHLDSMQKASNS